MDLLRGASPEPAAHLAAGRAALDRLPYREIWVADTEFRAVGDPQRPWCLSAVELRTGREVNLWLDGYRGPCPFSTGPETLFVAFVAGAEVGTFLAMGWPMPARILDLFAEWRILTNTGLPSDARKLTAACERAGLPFVEATAKDANREEAITRTAWPEEERRRLLAYCREDTLATARLFLWLLPRWLAIHAGQEEAALAYALHRGRYAAEMARAERRGIPFQVAEWRTLQAGKAGIFASMVEALPADLSPFVLESGDWVFRFDRFERIVAGLGLAGTWPRTATGQLSTSREWLEQIVGSVPELRPVFEAMGARSRTNLLQCQVGGDGRARCPFFPFSSATGRSLPSNAKFIYGAPKLFRHVIQAPPGGTVIQLDYVAQESAIAAAFAEDDAMIAAYQAGDVHLHAAKAVGLVPEGATKGTHKAERDRLKAVNLGVVYGARERRIAAQLRIPLAEAGHLLETHRRIFPKLWRWIERAVSSAEVSRVSVTQDFWRKTVPAPFSPTVAANFPVQSTGQSILREAVVNAGAAGLPVIATVHDALVLEAEEREAREVARAAERIMVAAAAVFCPGITMRVDVSTTTDPEAPLADPELRPRYDQVLRRAAAAAAEAQRQGGWSVSATGVERPRSRGGAPTIQQGGARNSSLSSARSASSEDKGDTPRRSRYALPAGPVPGLPEPRERATPTRCAAKREAAFAKVPLPLVPRLPPSAVAVRLFLILLARARTRAVRRADGWQSLDADDLALLGNRHRHSRRRAAHALAAAGLIEVRVIGQHRAEYRVAPAALGEAEPAR